MYDSLVRMAQEFSLRYTLVDGQGNFGSRDGDSPAAMRYTEAKLTKMAAELLQDINKDTVDFKPNFDDHEMEPVVLPARFPNLLVNGSSGIAVGMATNIPPHNLGEVIDGIFATLDNPEITIEELNDYIKGPDFPTYGTIIGRSGIRQAYKTGKGRVVVRSKTELEEKVLVNFYLKVKPGGPGWNKVMTNAVKKGMVKENNVYSDWDVPMGLLCMSLGCIAIFGFLFAIGYLLYGELTMFYIILSIAVISSALLFKFWGRLFHS